MSSKGMPPAVDHTEFMIKPPALDIRVEPTLNPRATFLAQLEPPSATPNHAVLTIALPDMKGSIVLDTTLLASKKDVPADKQLFLPKDEVAMMRWIVVGLNHLLQNYTKFGLPPLQDMLCARDMNTLTLKINGTARDFRLITRTSAAPLVKYLNELYAPDSPYLAKDEPLVSATVAAPEPVAEVKPPVVVVEPAPVEVVATPAAPPPVAPATIEEIAGIVLETAEPATPMPIATPTLETGMLFLSKSGSGKLRTVDVIEGFAHLYEKEPEGEWSFQREFDPTEWDVFVDWLYANCDLQPGRVAMAAVIASRPAS